MANRGRWKKLAGATGVAGVVLFAALYVGHAQSGKSDSGLPAPHEDLKQPWLHADAAVDFNALRVGDMVKFIFLPTPKAVADITFLDADGRERSLGEWRGRAVLINLWATWCAPCRVEMPSLDRLRAKLGSEAFDVLAVSIDRGGPARPRAMLESLNISSLAFLRDPTMKIQRALGVRGLPTTLLIDAEGREIGRLAGVAEWDEPEAIALIRAAAGLPESQ